MTEQEPDYTPRWQPHPFVAALLRAFVLIAPILASVAFVHIASGVVPAPRGWGLPRIAWWIGLSAAAMVVLVGIDRLTRRLLPLAALLKLALVFPDEAPSRFRTALTAGTTDDLEERLAQARERHDSDTPAEAIERLLGFVAALSTHDRLTRGHSERVRAYAQMIAKELRLGRDDVDRLNWAALLHDIGKLEVPAEILNKPGRPSEAEWELIRSHPELGARLAAPLRVWLGEWTDAIADHHERWDGTGYPKGETGDRISLAGRIVAVADVFDVITSTRSYKDSGSAVDARDEIARCSGEQFDPRVVRAFLSISLGRLRLAMGPLSWLAQAPILGRIPLAPGLATVATSVGAVVATLAAGLAGGAHVATSTAASARAVPVRSAPLAPRGAPSLAIAGPGRHGGHSRLVVFAPLAAVTASQIVSDALPAASPPASPPVDPVQTPLSRGPAAPASPAPPPVVPPATTAPVVVPPALPPATPSPLPPVALPVNHAPSFTAGADQTVNENAGPQTVAGWAHAIAPGPADEAGQVVSFSVTSSDAALFTAGGQPALAGNGTLSFTPAAGAHGAATLTVRALDDGGTANGGVDVSAPQTVLVTVVNRPPAAVADAPSVLENSVAGVTFDVFANDSDPESDALSVASYDDSTIADGALAHGAGGSFTYVPATHFAGTDTFSYTVSDGNGNTATTTATITVTAVPDPPTPGDDAYVTPQSVAFVEPAPGVLANDSDTGALTVDTTPVVPPANGLLALAADGSFTYTPTLGFTGADAFTYRVTSASSGLTATAVVTITVSATFSSSTLFLTGSGISSEVWNLSTSSQPNSLLGIVPDYDGNLLAGLTLKSSNGSDSGDAQRSQTWRYPLPAGLVLVGPVVLHLTSSGSGNNVDYAYLYDCTAAGASCVQIGYGSTTWNGGLLGLGWVSNDISLGTVNRTLAVGHELRLRTYSGSGDQAVAMTGDFPSSLTLTVP